MYAPLSGRPHKAGQFPCCVSQGQESGVADFIDEVDEEVRRERMQSLWKRWSPLIIAAVILLLAAVGGWQFWQNYRADKAAAASAAFTAALNEAQAGRSEEHTSELPS